MPLPLRWGHTKSVKFARLKDGLTDRQECALSANTRKTIQPTQVIVFLHLVSYLLFMYNFAFVKAGNYLIVTN